LDFLGFLDGGKWDWRPLEGVIEREVAEKEIVLYRGGRDGRFFK
jgi:hypothetical protein